MSAEEDKKHTAEGTERDFRSLSPDASSCLDAFKSAALRLQTSESNRQFNQTARPPASGLHRYLRSGAEMKAIREFYLARESLMDIHRELGDQIIFNQRTPGKAH